MTMLITKPNAQHIATADDEGIRLKKKKKLNQFEYQAPVVPLSIYIPRRPALASQLKTTLLGTGASNITHTPAAAAVYTI